MIKLKDGYAIDLADGLNFKLQKEVTRVRKADGTKYKDYQAVGYYGTIQQCLVGYLKYRTKEEDSTTLKDILNKIYDVEKYISELNLSEISTTVQTMVQEYNDKAKGKRG